MKADANSPSGSKPVAIACSSGFIIGGRFITPPPGLDVTNYNHPQVYRFRGRNRSVTVNEIIIHESVTRSVADTVNILRNRNLGVHLMIGPDGRITQLGDLLNVSLGHAYPHNTRSVGVEVVNPYYPKYCRARLPWGKIITAGWAHEGRYVLPTIDQAEAVACLIGWITSPAARGLSVPGNWIGVTGNRISMSRVTDTDRARPGIYAHTYFHHADGAWLILYSWLRLERRLTREQAYREAIRLGTTAKKTITLRKSSCECADTLSPELVVK
ncbi:MAG: N-acetylmuramoyl-L-alanine amidase [candidate division Zixibacteria bacterium]